MAHSFMYGHLTVLGQFFDLLAGVAQFFALLLRQLGQELHALQSLLTFFRWQAVEFLQTLTQSILAVRRKLFKFRIVLQQFQLLVKWKIFVGFKPIAHLPSAFLSSTIAVSVFLSLAGLQGYHGNP